MKFTLTATDMMASVLQSMTPETGVTQKQSYSAYGETFQSVNDVQIPGFNGERRDPLTGTTHLGNGYRAYNPTLMRFHAPDSMSPFGAGGINCYAYCNGDPINNSDPSGHMSAQAGVGIGLGVLGLTLGAASFGVSIAAKVAVVASLSAIATGIASAATENSNPEASAALGWASMGLGIAGAATGIFSAAKGIKRTGEFVGEWQYRLQHAGGKPGKLSGGAPYGKRIGGGDNATIYEINGDSRNVLKLYRKTATYEQVLEESLGFNSYYGRGSSSLMTIPDGDGLTLKMKKIKGNPLNKMSRGALPGNSLDLFDAMIKKLGDKNIMHTDLSKGNILWDGEVKEFNPVDFTFDESRINGATNAADFYQQDRNTRWSREHVFGLLM
ncbi:RHS repeat-associated core domain [Serratia quinivorans]|nr:RHS repeat-associated core domain [Serratia quinivorans]CAI1533716.1 RHS repeat-associated core domain [Serratia quinivorans]